MKESSTKFDRFKSRIKNNPILATLMALGMVIIALSTFTNAAKNLLGMVMKETRPNVNGAWTAEVTYPFKEAIYMETFIFNGKGNEIHGVASYLENEQVILEGKLTEGGQIEFKTKTREYAPDWDNHNIKLATHHYRGRTMGSEIKLVMETYGGFSSYQPIEIIAKRVPDKAN